MALTAATQISQGSNCSQFTVTDSSNYGGSDPKANISSRVLVVFKSDGTVFTTINFSYALYPSDSVVITGLDKDYSFLVIMTLTPLVPVLGSVYVANNDFALKCYTMTGFYQRMKNASLQPYYERNKNFTTDTFNILMDADVAVAAAASQDISSAQLLLDTAAKIQSSFPMPY